MMNEACRVICKARRYDALQMANATDGNMQGVIYGIDQAR